MSIQSISIQMATWVGVLGAILGGFMGLQTYRADVAQRVDDRSKLTFELIQRFQDPSMRTIREPILRAVMADLACQPGPAEPVTDTELFTFVEFFDMIQSCLDADLCDQELATQYFSPYANGHVVGLRAHIEQIRATEREQELPNPYGYGLERLATNPAARLDCPERQIR